MEQTRAHFQLRPVMHLRDEAEQEYTHNADTVLRGEVFIKTK